jgi:hypothetical protein
MTLRAQWASYRNSLWLLAQFEGARAYLHAIEGAALLLAVPALPLAVLYATVYVATGRPAQLALGGLLIAATSTAAWLCKRRLWEQPVFRRLAEWQSSNPELGEVGVAIADLDVRRASIVLMRAHLHTRYFRRGNRIPDAPELDYYMAVVLPLIVPQVAFEQVAEKTRETLRDAGIRARVVGVDVP